MGSRFSKAIRPKQEASMSRVKTIEDDETKKTNQDPAVTFAPQLPNITSHDDITTIFTVSQPESETAPTSTASTNPAMEQQTEPALEDTSLALAEQQILSIEFAATDPDPPWPLVPFTPPPPPEPELQCVICCITLPKESEARHVEDVIFPCKCKSAYCVDCIKNMFIQACKDTTLMPPRCCKPIHLHHVRNHLTNEEITIFKSKYEEFQTPQPLYCPVPTCSAFIPERLQPAKGRADSGVGTPTVQNFACPACETKICLSCRQPAHPDSMCQMNEFGVDADTSALLVQWGYKKCPKCSAGIKRMYGCNHIVCRCKASFCYMCMQDNDKCNGYCYDSNEDINSNEEPDEPEELISIPEPMNTSVTAIADSLPEAAAVAPTTGGAAQTSSDVPNSTTQPQPIPRIRNLDGGSHQYWENREDLNFGEDPADQIEDDIWTCKHNFEIYKVSLASALTKDPSTTEMECEKCWSVIQPEIEAKNGRHETVVPARAGHRRRGVTRRRGWERGRYTPPRGIFRTNTTVGTAPHLTSDVSVLSQSLPTRQMSPIDDIQFHRIVDTYGNTITTEEKQSRRASFGSSTDTVMHKGEPANWKSLDGFNFTFNAPSNIFLPAAPKFSLAYECKICSLLVCEACKTTPPSK